MAQLLGLQFHISAGIITILCIKPTKKQSFQAAGERFLACLFGLVCASVFLQLFGYHPWVLSLVLLILIPICVKWKLTDGIVSSFVIVLHLYVLKTISMSIVMNEIALMIIGIGFALLLNLHIPSLEKELKDYQQQIEANFKKIIAEFAIYLRTGTSDWDGKEITTTTELLEKAKRLAAKNIENYTDEKGPDFYTYFEVREKQFDILVRLMPIVSSFPGSIYQGELIADFLDELQEGIHPGNTADKYLQQLYLIRKRVRNTPLPKDNKEFELRASLFHLVNEFERYLFIKKSLSEQKKGKNK